MQSDVQRTQELYRTLARKQEWHHQHVQETGDGSGRSHSDQPFTLIILKLNFSIR